VGESGGDEGGASKGGGSDGADRQRIRRVSDAYDRQAESWRGRDPRDSWDYILSKMQTDYLLLRHGLEPGDRVLNIGCSFPIDELAYARRASSWVAIDPNPNVVEFARRVTDAELSPELAARLRYEIGDVTELAFADAEFDLVVAFSTLDHLPSETARRRGLAEMARVLRPGGRMIVTAPNRWNLPYTLWSRRMQRRGDADFGYEYEFSPRELARLLRDVGCRPVLFASTLGNTLPVRPKPTLLAQRALRAIPTWLGKRMGYLARK
jgi:SAM-dependent methyltransferase